MFGVPLLIWSWERSCQNGKHRAIMPGIHRAAMSNIHWETMSGKVYPNQ
jgi:hypothetical protein